MILKEFWGVVTSVQYKTTQSYFSPEGEMLFARLEVDAFEEWDHESIEPIKYYADLGVIEGKDPTPNKRRRKNKLTVRVRLTKEDYANKVIKENDVIKFKSPRVHTSTFRVKSFDEEKIKEAPAKKIKTDPVTKKPYVDFKATTIFISCGANAWVREYDIKHRYYWELNGVQFKSEKKDQLLSQRKFAFYIEKEEFDKLLPLNKKQAMMSAFNKTGVIAEMLVDVKVGYRADIEKYACSIVAVQEPEIFKCAHIARDTVVVDSVPTAESQETAKVESAPAPVQEVQPIQQEVQEPQVSDNEDTATTTNSVSEDWSFAETAEVPHTVVGLPDNTPVEVEDTPPVIVDIAPAENIESEQPTVVEEPQEDNQTEETDNEPDLDNLMW